MSVFYQILDAVKTGLATELAPYGVPVVLKRRAVWTQTDSLPVVIVAPHGDETIAEQDWTNAVGNDAGGTTWVYPVCVNMIYPDDRHNDLELEAQEYLDIRQTIRYWLYYPLLTGVPTVFDCDMGGNVTSFGEYGTKPFELADQKSTFSSTIWIPKYKSREERRVT